MLRRSLSAACPPAARPLISKALKAYRPKRDRENALKARNSRTETIFSLLDTYSLPQETPLFEIKGKAPKRYALAPAHIPFDSELEQRFARYLDASPVDWWFKNGNFGADHFAIAYTDKAGVERLFYPDFIVRQGNRVGIIDTKSGLVAEEAKAKAKALHHYLKTTKGKFRLWGGIVTEHSGTWRINDRAGYDFTDPSDWRPLLLE